MKLLAKLTLSATISKIAIVLLFVWLLPLLVDEVAFQYTNYLLKQQEKKVFENIEKNGMDFYLQGDSSYGSYTLLKEEYISLEASGNDELPDTIQTSKRLVEGDTLTYRLLVRNFEYDQKRYTLEIGKTIASIRQYNRPLQKVALYVLAGLVLVTLVIDLVFTRILLRPLDTIIRTKLISPKFPFRDTLVPITTSTSDFKYLDDSLISLMNRITEDFEREKAFTSNASHELMTPISVLQTKLENLMLSSDIDEETQQKIMGMMRTLNRLKKIVNALLLISRIENDQYVRKNAIHVKKLMSEITEELSLHMEDKNISLSVDLKDDIVLDHMNNDLIFQLFYNLITNAIRYNREGGKIIIRDMPGHNTYTVVIEDTGTGISAENLGSIFSRFKRAAPDGTEGAGLGLSIVKSIADYHRIRIDISSVEGTGTKVKIIFPSIH